MRFQEDLFIIFQFPHGTDAAGRLVADIQLDHFAAVHVAVVFHLDRDAQFFACPQRFRRKSDIPADKF